MKLYEVKSHLWQTDFKVGDVVLVEWDHCHLSTDKHDISHFWSVATPSRKAFRKWGHFSFSRAVQYGFVKEIDSVPLDLVPHLNKQVKGLLHISEIHQNPRPDGTFKVYPVYTIPACYRQ